MGSEMCIRDRPIREFLKNNRLMLRVCLSHSALKNVKLNCSTCVKCLARIAGLVLAGIDPNYCGFEVDHSTFKLMKSIFEKRKAGSVRLLETRWKVLQSMIPERIEGDLYGSKEFFEWFKNFNLDLARKDVWFYRDLYNRLPYPLACLLDVVYDILGINIHEHSPIRPNQKRVNDN